MSEMDEEETAPGMGMGMGAEPEAEEATAGEDAASPEEEQQLEVFLDNALQVIYDEKGDMRPQVKKGMTGSDPVTSLATTVASVVKATDTSAAKGGMEVGGEILLEAGRQLLQVLADYADAAGIHTFNDEELKSAAMMATDKYREMQGAGVDQQAAAADWQELVAADKEGRLNEVLPGVDQFKGPVRSVADKADKAVKKGEKNAKKKAKAKPKPKEEDEEADDET